VADQFVDFQFQVAHPPKNCWGISRNTVKDWLLGERYPLRYSYVAGDDVIQDQLSTHKEVSNLMNCHTCEAAVKQANQ
jgi:hypothetical protein